MSKKRSMKKLNKKAVIGITSGVVLIVVGVIAFFVLNGKAKDDTNEPKKTDAPVQEVKHLKIVDENSKSRPFAVMINNAADARALQSGLQDAYIMYEIIVEGGITRYMALFKDQETARIGSIRSARHYYLDYALENDAIYVHHGQSPQAQNDFGALKVDRVVVNDSTTGWRDKEIRAKGYATEHTLFTSIEKLKNGTSKLRTETNKDLLLKYSIDEINMADIPNAKKADTAAIKYSAGTTSGYTYDAEKGYYLRTVNGKAHKDYVTGEQYHFKNIITYQVKNYTLNDGENKGRQNIENIGSGTGYYISGGYAIPIKWEKKSRSAQTKYTLENGEELVVNDGNTFIQIQPKGLSLDIS